MAKKTSSSSSTTTTRSTSYIMNVLSYVAVCVGGVALFIAMILGKLGVGSVSFIGILQAVANAIGWAVLCILSFRYISHRRKIWMWVVWAIAIVMIIIGIILPIF